MKDFWQRCWDLIAYSETKPTRFMLACIATMWAVGLLLPGDTFERPSYQYMRSYGLQEMHWTVFWLIYAIGTFWNVFVQRPNITIKMAMNILGLGLFSIVAIAIYLSRPTPFPAGIAPDIVIAFAAFWVLIRTPQR